MSHIPPDPSTPPLPPLPPSDGLQFDKVEYGTAGGGNAASCASCDMPITDTYYEVNGQIMCTNCKAQLQQAIAGGSKAMRMLQAFSFGFAAMVLSSIAYYLVRKLANAEFAIASIAIGWGIGWAVHRGAGGRGGLFYQLTAVLLTYCAIAFSYAVPYMRDISTNALPVIARVFGYVLAIPVSAGIQSPILFLIYIFGLWQAFRMNARPRIVVTGPYSTRGGAAAAAPPPGDTRVI